MRYPLSPRKKPPIPIEIHVWDVETKTEADGILTPFLVGYTDRSGYRSFRGNRCIRGFIDYVVETLDDGAIVWAHNGGGFDHLFVISEVVNDPDFQLTTVLSGSSCILVWMLHKPSGKTIVLMDSMRVFLTSLKKMAESLWPDGAIRKGTIDLTGTDDNDTRWIEYNATDCLILYKSLEYVQKALNEMGGNLRLTGGSCAIDLFQRRYLDRELWPSTYEQHESLFRRASYGGRTEIFDLRLRTMVKTFDANALYPYACTFPLPTKFLKYANGVEGRQRLRDCLRHRDLVGFVDATVEVPNVHIPPLPVKTNKLIFPWGRFSGSWSTADLENLELAGGRVTDVKQIVVYEAAPVAAEMMETLFAKRHTADRSPEGRALVAGSKVTSNSWFGKTLQKPKREQHRIRPDPEWLEQARAKGEQWEPHDSNGVLWKRTVNKHQPHMLPHIGAHITALARRRHYEDMFKLGDQVIYCDTDSIITTAELPTAPGLGKWKLEQEWDWFQAFLPKLYHGSVGGKVITKAKGFGGWNKADYVDGIVAHLTAGGQVKVSAPAKLKTLLALGDMRPRERTIKKQIRSTYDKRIVHPDGTTSPLHIDDMKGS